MIEILNKFNKWLQLLCLIWNAIKTEPLNVGPLRTINQKHEGIPMVHVLLLSAEMHHLLPGTLRSCIIYWQLCRCNTTTNLTGCLTWGKRGLQCSAKTTLLIYNLEPDLIPDLVWRRILLAFAVSPHNTVILFLNVQSLKRVRVLIKTWVASAMT